MPTDLTDFEREQMRLKVIEDRKYHGIEPPPLPAWAAPGEPIPRKCSGRNVTAERLEEYERRVAREKQLRRTNRLVEQQRKRRAW